MEYKINLDDQYKYKIEAAKKKYNFKNNNDQECLEYIVQAFLDQHFCSDFNSWYEYLGKIKGYHEPEDREQEAYFNAIAGRVIPTYLKEEPQKDADNFNEIPF